MNWNYRGFSFFFLLAVSLLTGFGLPHLRTDTTSFSLISQFDPDRDALEQVLKEFGADKRTRIYLRDDKLWTEAKLLLLRELHTELEGLDFVERVDDLFTHRLIRGKGGELETGEILPGIPQEKGELEKIRDKAVNDPLVAGSLLSRDGKWTALTLSLKEEKEGKGINNKRQTALEDLVTAHRKDFQEIFEIGPQRLDAEFHEALVKDCLLLGPAFALLVSLTVLLLLRCWASALVPLATAGLALLWTFGAMGWAGIPLTISGAMLPPFVICFAFISGVHVVFVCRQTKQRDRSPLGARSVMKLVGINFFTVIVMATGLSAYAATGIEFIKGFALAAIFAGLANGVALLMVLPHVLYFVESRKSGDCKAPSGKNEADAPGKLLKLTISSPASTVAIVLFFTAFSLYQGARLTASADPTSYFRASSPLLRQIKELKEAMSGTKTFRITLSSDKENAFLEPRNIERLTIIQKFLEKQGMFASSTSLADLLSLANREFLGGSQKHYLPPKKKELIAQYLLLFNRQELSDYASHDLRRATILVRHEIAGSELLNDYVKELKNVISNVAGVDMKASVTGENLMENAGATLLHRAWGRSLLLQGAVVLLMVSLMFTSPFGGVAALTLSVIPMITTLGLMGATQVPLNIGTAMVFIVTFGFILNGTLHLFSRYCDLCRTTPDYSLAVLKSLREETLPMGVTAIALIAGFFLLVFSNFSFVAQMGLFAAAGLVFSVLTLFWVAPLVLSRIRLVGLYEILQMSVKKGPLEKSSLFKGMTRYQIKKAILISELHEFEPGMLLVEQGSIGRSMFLILEGEAEVVLQRGGELEERRLAILEPGQVFGEIGYVMENKRSADVRAMTRVHALRFDYEQMKNDLKFFPFIVAKINFNMCRIMGERLAGAVDTLTNYEDRK